MATVTVYTAQRMKKIEDETVVSGHVDGDILMLETREGTLINAGNVRGSKGDKGAQGDVSLAQLNVVAAAAATADTKAQNAQNTANAALTAANSAQVITRGSHKTGSGNSLFHAHWLDFSNGVRMQWADIRMQGTSSVLVFEPHGALYTAQQPSYLYPGFANFVSDPVLQSPRTLPVISIGTAQYGAWYHTWGQAEYVTPSTFNFRLWSAIPRGKNEILILSYFAVGYRTKPN